MGEGKPWYFFRKEIIEALSYLSFSEHFGWTPKQIRELTEEERMIYISLLSGSSSREENG